MDGHIMRCGTIGSYQPAASFRGCKALLVTSLTHVSGATCITSVETFNDFDANLHKWSTEQRHETIHFVSQEVMWGQR